MNSEIESALDDCLQMLRDGAGLNHCLVRYPELGPALRPLLETASRLQSTMGVQPSPEARATGRARLLTAFQQQTAVRPSLWQRLRAKTNPRKRLAWVPAALVTILFLALTSGATIAASKPSLPGDRLYPVKIGVQQTQLTLTFDSKSRQELEARFQSQRREEIQQVLVWDRRAQVEFFGILEKIDASTWLVGGLPVTLQADTIIHGQPRPGALVHVRGRLPGNGQLLATELTVGSIEDDQMEEITPVEIEKPVLDVDDTPEASETPKSTAVATGTPDDNDESTPEPTATPEAEEGPDDHGDGDDDGDKGGHGDDDEGDDDHDDDDEEEEEPTATPENG